MHPRKLNDPSCCRKGHCRPMFLQAPRSCEQEASFIRIVRILERVDDYLAAGGVSEASSAYLGLGLGFPKHSTVTKSPLLASPQFGGQMWDCIRNSGTRILVAIMIARSALTGSAPCMHRRSTSKPHSLGFRLLAESSFNTKTGTQTQP